MYPCPPTTIDAFQSLHVVVPYHSIFNIGAPNRGFCTVVLSRSEYIPLYNDVARPVVLASRIQVLSYILCSIFKAFKHVIFRYSIPELPLERYCLVMYSIDIVIMNIGIFPLIHSYSIVLIGRYPAGIDELILVKLKVMCK